MYRWSCLSMEAWHVTPYTGIIREKSRVHYVVLYVEYVHGGTLPVKSGANVEAISRAKTYEKVVRDSITLTLCHLVTCTLHRDIHFLFTSP